MVKDDANGKQPFQRACLRDRKGIVVPFLFGRDACTAYKNEQKKDDGQRNDLRCLYTMNTYNIYFTRFGKNVNIGLLWMILNPYTISV